MYAKLLLVSQYMCIFFSVCNLFESSKRVYGMPTCLRLLKNYYIEDTSSPYLHLSLLLFEISSNG